VAQGLDVALRDRYPVTGNPRVRAAHLPLLSTNVLPSGCAPLRGIGRNSFREGGPRGRIDPRLPEH
jgi:hypothetical protein